MGNSPRYVGFIDPPYIVTLTDDSGAALDLTGCTSNSFTLTMINVKTGLSQQCAGVWTIANQTTNKGQVSYQWTNADMATAGLWSLYTTVKLPAEPGPREFDPELIEVLPGTVGAGAAPPGVLPAPIAKAIFFNGADYGVVGDGSDQTVAFNATLAAAHAAGGGIAYIDTPNVTISAPLRVYSNTTLMLSPKTTVTLAANSNCNMLQNYGVQANRRVTDGVTNSTTTFTSATASFVSGDVGKAVRIYYQNGTFLDTTIASITNSTTARLAAAATFSQTGLYASIGAGRDSNIKVLGGNWIRPTPNYGTTVNTHNIRFVHVDGLEVGSMNFTTNDGKYAINLCDTTDFYVHDVIGQYLISDCVHMNGPVSHGAVERITSHSSGDDIVSITCQDYTGLAENYGNIDHISIRTIRAVTNTPGTRITPIEAGSSTTGHGFTVNEIDIRDITCELTAFPIFIAGDINMQGGTYGRIRIDGGINTSASPPGGFVALRQLYGGATINEVEVRSVVDVGATTDVLLEATSAATRLVCVGIAPSRIAVYGSVTTLDIIDTPVTLTGAQTINGVKSIAPPTPGGSASLLFDNQATTDQVWEVYCDTGGAFGLSDRTGNIAQIIKVDKGAQANMFELGNGTITLRQTTFVSSKLVMQAGLQFNYLGVSSAHSVDTNNDTFIGVDSSTVAITVTLPNIGWTGQTIIIKDVTGHAATHAITVAASGGQTIDGAASIVIGSNYGLTRVISTGSGWAAW